MLLSNITSEMTKRLINTSNSIKKPKKMLKASKKIKKKSKEDNILKSNKLNIPKKNIAKKKNLWILQTSEKIGIFNVYDEDILKNPKKIKLKKITHIMDNDVSSDEDIVNHALIKVYTNLKEGINNCKSSGSYEFY